MASSCAFLLVTFAAFLCCTVATEVGKCSAGPSPVKVDIVGCDKEPCTIFDGTDAMMNVTFVVPNDSAVLNLKVRATIKTITVTLTDDPRLVPDVSKYLVSGHCPLKKGDTIVYNFKMPIKDYPKFDILLEFSLLGEKNEVFQCFKVNCNIVHGPASRQLN